MEDLMLNIFICLIVPLAMSLFVFQGKSRKLIFSLLLGIVMCLFAGQINGLIASSTHLDSYTLTSSITPAVEEIVKIIPILALTFVFNEDRQTLLECSLMIGIGFATMENVYILTNNYVSINFFQAFSRGLGSAMVHTTTTLLISYGISLCRVRKKTFITGTYAILIAAMVFHGIYNMLVQTNRFLYLGLLLPSLVFISISLAAAKQRKVVQTKSD